MIVFCEVTRDNIINLTVSHKGAGEVDLTESSGDTPLEGSANVDDVILLYLDMFLIR